MLRLRGLTPSIAARLLAAGMRRTSFDSLCVFLCVADHFEPMWGGAPKSLQNERVARWVSEYPEKFGDLGDSRGRPPQHTYFWPAEEYDAEHLEMLAGLCRRGFGDVEVHLHHDNDTADTLRETLETFADRLHRQHGLLSRNEAGQLTYGFIHGNWALANSRPDGRWCGVDTELTVLRETGCYADFTMPSAPDPTQTRMVNSIYYGIDTPGRCKSHDTGVPARVGLAPPKDGLLLIQGPLMLDWRRRKFGAVPGLENAELHGGRTASVARLRLWLKAQVKVAGKPDWAFVKLHTHGAPEKNANMLLGESMRRFHKSLAEFAKQHDGFRYYYVTAREMAQLVHQAEQGRATPSFETTSFESTNSYHMV